VRRVRLGAHPRLLALLAALVLVAGLAIVTGPQFSPALGGLLVRDPALSIAPSASASPGALIALHPGGAIGSSAYVAFSDANGIRALTPAFTTAAGDTVAVAPAILRDGVAAEITLRAQLVVHSGPVWRGSNTVDVAIGAPARISAATGAPTLFYLDVGLGLMAEMARRGDAAREVAPAEATAYGSAMSVARGRLELVRAALAAKVGGDARSLGVDGGTVTSEDLASLDQLIVGHLAGLGPASPSPCGEAKDREVAAVLRGEAATESAIHDRAAVFTSAILGCPDEQLRDVTRRMAGWYSSVVSEVAATAKAPYIALFQQAAIAVGEGYVEQSGWRGASVQAVLGRNETELSDVLARMMGATSGSTSYYTAVYQRLESSGASWAFELDLYRQQAALHTQIDRARADPQQKLTVERLVELLLAAQPAQQGAASAPSRSPTSSPTRSATAVAASVSPTPTASAPPTATITPPPTPAPTPTPTPTVAPTPVLTPQSTSTVSAARDLTGTWRGGIASKGFFNGAANCQWTGSMTLTLAQTGNSLAGQVRLDWRTATAVDPSAGCLLDPEGYAVTGTVSASAVRMQFSGQGSWYGTLNGSFTTDLMSGTFSGSGSDYGTGCFQLSRTSIGALPSCGR